MADQFTVFGDAHVAVGGEEQDAHGIDPRTIRKQRSRPSSEVTSTPPGRGKERDMGVLRALFPKKIKDPVQGTAQIVACSGPADDATSSPCQMQLVVQVEGREPYAVEHTEFFKHRRWPSPGMTVPVTVSRSDPNHLRVEKEGIPDWRDAGMNQAEQIAASMQGGPSAAPGVGGQMIDLSGDPGAAAQKIAMVEQVTGMDLNADGKIGAASAGSAGTPPPGEATDRVEGLERLAKLHESGALTDAEFEAEKAKLLGT